MNVSWTCHGQDLFCAEPLVNKVMLTVLASAAAFAALAVLRQACLDCLEVWILHVMRALIIQSEWKEMRRMMIVLLQPG